MVCKLVHSDPCHSRPTCCRCTSLFAVSTMLATSSSLMTILRGPELRLAVRNTCSPGPDHHSDADPQGRNHTDCRDTLPQDPAIRSRYAELE